MSKKYKIIRVFDKDFDLTRDEFIISHFLELSKGLTFDGKIEYLTDALNYGALSYTEYEELCMMVKGERDER